MLNQSVGWPGVGVELVGKSRVGVWKWVANAPARTAFGRPRSAGARRGGGARRACDGFFDSRQGIAHVDKRLGDGIALITLHQSEEVGAGASRGPVLAQKAEGRPWEERDKQGRPSYDQGKGRERKRHRNHTVKTLETRVKSM